MFSPLRSVSIALVCGALVFACSSVDDGATGVVEADLTSCSAYSTCEACSSGMNCFWAGGCCVALSVNDRFPNGGVVAGHDYAAHPRECASYADVNGPNSTRSSGECGGAQPRPQPPPSPTWSCPGRLVTVTKNTFLENVTTNDRYGCFGFDVLVSAQRRESCHCSGEPVERVRFKLCADAACTPTDGLGEDVLERGGSFMSISPGYHNQAPGTRLLLTASTLSGRPAKICYRDLHACD